MASAIQLGTVYVAALNRKGTLAALGEALLRDPYKAPPKAPVLHLKPANTWAGPDDPIVCPAGEDGLRMGGALGLVIGRSTSRVTESNALDRVESYRLVNDVSIPYRSYYRPVIKERCRDGFLPVGIPTPGRQIADPDRVEVVVEIDGVIRCRAAGDDLIRGAARLLAEVSQFITFEPGDLLVLGEAADAPVARPGARVRVLADGLAPLDNRIVAEGEAA